MRGRGWPDRSRKGGGLRERVSAPPWEATPPPSTAATPDRGVTHLREQQNLDGRPPGDRSPPLVLPFNEFPQSSQASRCRDSRGSRGRTPGFEGILPFVSRVPGIADRHPRGHGRWLSTSRHPSSEGQQRVVMLVRRRPCVTVRHGVWRTEDPDSRAILPHPYMPTFPRGQHVTRPL